MKKRISIALATYNGELFLSELLDSLLKQTLLPDEIIVVDDKSSDKTLLILESYSARYPLIKVYPNERNLGVNKNFEKAITLCTGDYILICDQDDIWLPYNIEKKMKALSQMPENEPGFVCHYSIPVDKNLCYLAEPYCRSFNKALEIFPISFQGCTMAVNRAFLNNLGEIPNSFKDFTYDAYLEYLALLIANVQCIAEPLLLYRIHEKNTSKISKKKTIKIISKILSFRSYSLTAKNLCNLKSVVDSIQQDLVKTDRKTTISYLTDCCFSNNRIIWKNLFKIPGLSFCHRIKIISASFFRFLKNYKIQKGMKK